MKNDIVNKESDLLIEDLAFKREYSIFLNTVYGIAYKLLYDK